MTTNKQIDNELQVEDYIQNARDLQAKLIQIANDEQPGYAITISIKKDGDDQQYDYELYDLAAFINDLMPAVDTAIQDMLGYPTEI